MDEIDLKRQKYNYVNTTKNIITCFSIVGYEINTIKDYILPKIDDYYEFSDDVLHEDKKILNTYPSILYSVVEENDKTGINPNLLIEHLLSEIPSIYFIKNNNYELKNIENNKEPKIKNLISCFGAETAEKNTMVRTGSNIYGFLFYEKFTTEKKNYIVYIPKIFAYTTQTLFFNFLHHFSLKLLKYFEKNNIEIPIEVQLYNIVNFLPCPRESNINANLFLENYLLKYNEPKYKKSVVDKGFKIPQLSGIPIFDIDITQVFKFISLNDFTQSLIYILKGYSMLFLTNDLENYRIFAFILKTICYPIQGDIFNLVKSISLADYNDENSTYKNFLLLGMNKKFDIKDIKNKENISKISQVVIYDFESNKFYDLDKYDKYDWEDDLRKKLNSYIHDIIEKKVTINNENESFPYILITNLHDKLSSIVNVALETDQTPRNEINYFTKDQNRLKYNLLILEAIYEYCLELGHYLNNYWSYSFEERKITLNTFFKNNDKKNKEDYTEKNELDRYFFSQSEKGIYKATFDVLKQYMTDNIQDLLNNLYQMRSYFFFIFSGFLQENDDENEIKYDKYIELIDDFYRKDSKDKITNINFFDFYIFYQNNLKEYFFKNVNSNIVKTKLIKIKDIRKVYYIYQKEERDKNKEMTYNLDSNILVLYLRKIKNMKDNFLQKIFPSKIIRDKEVYTNINSTEVIKYVEKNFYNNKLIKYIDILKGCLIYLVSLTVEKHNISYCFIDLINLFYTMNYGLRKGVLIIINILRKLRFSKKKESDEEFINNTGFYLKILDLLRIKSVFIGKEIANKIINMFKLSDIEKEKRNININQVDNKYKMIENLKKEDLYVMSLEDNECHNEKYDLKKLILCNKTNDDYNNNLSFKCSICNNVKTAFVKFKPNKINIKKEIPEKIELFSPLKLYEECYKIYIQYTNTLDLKIIENTKEFINLIINILFYCENTNGFNLKIIKFVLTFLLDENE